MEIKYTDRHRAESFRHHLGIQYGGFCSPDAHQHTRTTTLGPALTVPRGQVVFVNSSVTPSANVGNYAASKYALRALADAFRDEVNGSDIRVLSVYPGPVASPMQEMLHDVESRTYYPERLIQPDDVASLIVHTLGLPRTVEVTDIHMRPMQKPLHGAAGESGSS